MKGGLTGQIWRPHRLFLVIGDIKKGGVIGDNGPMNLQTFGMSAPICSKSMKHKFNSRTSNVLCTHTVLNKYL
jgi:hypothetical protein